jgi:protein-L-isoaspartate(D-aspartate) O-methyltransferase
VSVVSASASSRAAVMDVERARHNMVEQQIRTWEVLDASVLELMGTIRREEFVPAAERALAFVDMEVPLRLHVGDTAGDTGQVMFAPKVEARLLQELALRPTDTVLEIGTGSGFMAALAAHKAQHVLSIEIDPALASFARENLKRAGVHNVKVEIGDGARGWAARSPYDAIIVSGGLPVLPDELLAQLKPGGRLTAIVGDPPAMSAVLVTRAGDAFETVRLFETSARHLTNAWRPNRFKF